MVLKMISKVVELSPYGAFALTAWVVGTQGLAIMLSLSKLVFAITIAMALQYLIFGLFIMIFCKMSPIPFYKKRKFIICRYILLFKFFVLFLFVIINIRKIF